ncbi:MAG TPA: SDR family NAD(P)-dependent oxidoreductase [Rhodopila sp.]|nr:SDR family NAD(P)-dependent oxidoreductase [Rhodopila sp.]
MSGTASGTRLQGRRVLITGGGSGIGRATAALFRAEGAKVAVLDRAVAADGELVLPCDVSDEGAVAAAVGKAAEALGGLDGLVNAAGIFHANTLADTPPDLWQRVIAVNLTGTYLVCRAALPFLQESGRQGGAATIVNIASGAGLLPTGPGSAAYVASKGGVIALTKVLAFEAAPRIRVNAVCPGAVETPMTAGMLRDAAGAVQPAIAQRYALQRPSAPEELARAILFLTSEESSSTTGISLAVDGGRTFH